jgi:succinate dehydrogenase / fumarate reductase iron-sulfur subunit
MQVILTVNRFNPEGDEKPHYQDFAVTVEKHAMVLDALQEARKSDPTLSFRRSCRSAICGSCAVTVNGNPGLVCHTLVADVTDDAGRITIDPLPGFRQLRDLVVDLEPFFESLRAVVPWLLLKDGHAGRVSPEDTAAVESPATCILCGACNAAMALPGEVKPVAAVKAWRLALDPRDRLGAARLRLLDVPPEVLRLFVRDLPQKCPKEISLAEELLEHWAE